MSTAINKYFIIPYVKSISESFTPIATKLNLKTVYTIPNTLKKFISHGKDKLDPMSYQDIVYKISHVTIAMPYTCRPS